MAANLEEATQAVLLIIEQCEAHAEASEVYDLSMLEDDLSAAIDAAHSGELDGNEIGSEDITVYMYGPNAEALFRSICPVLRANPLCQRGRVVIRPGPPEIVGRVVPLPVE